MRAKFLSCHCWHAINELSLGAARNPIRIPEIVKVRIGDGNAEWEI